MGGRAQRCLSGLGIALATLLGACGDEPIPLQVAWEPTIRQVFAAHCVRCHGAGGTLNVDPEVYGGTDSPTLAYLDHLQDQGDCTLDPVTMSVPDSCKRGALFVKDTIKLYVETTGSMRMPPAPSAPLTDYERDLILKWVDNPL